MSVIKKLHIYTPQGWSDPYDIGADATNISYNNSNVETTLDNLNNIIDNLSGENLEYSENVSINDKLDELSNSANIEYQNEVSVKDQLDDNINTITELETNITNKTNWIALNNTYSTITPIYYTFILEGNDSPRKNISLQFDFANNNITGYLFVNSTQSGSNVIYSLGIGAAQDQQMNMILEPIAQGSNGVADPIETSYNSGATYPYIIQNQDSYAICCYLILFAKQNQKIRSAYTDNV